MKRRLIVIAIIIGFLAMTGFIGFGKYFGSFKSEIPGKWEVTSGDGCFTQVRFFGGAEENKTIRLYEVTDSETTIYHGKYHTEGNTIFAELMADDVQAQIEMTYEQTDEALTLAYDWEGESLQCTYEQGAE